MTLQESFESTGGSSSWSFEEIARDLDIEAPSSTIQDLVDEPWRDLPSWGSLQVDPEWASEDRLNEVFATWSAGNPVGATGTERTFLGDGWATGASFPTGYDEPFAGESVTAAPVETDSYLPAAESAEAEPESYAPSIEVSVPVPTVVEAESYLPALESPEAGPAWSPSWRSLEQPPEINEPDLSPEPALEAVAATMYGAPEEPTGSLGGPGSSEPVDTAPSTAKPAFRDPWLDLIGDRLDTPDHPQGQDAAQEQSHPPVQIPAAEAAPPFAGGPPVPYPISLAPGQAPYPSQHAPYFAYQAQFAYAVPYTAYLPQHGYPIPPYGYPVPGSPAGFPPGSIAYSIPVPPGPGQGPIPTAVLPSPYDDVPNADPPHADTAGVVDSDVPDSPETPLAVTTGMADAPDSSLAGDGMILAEPNLGAAEPNPGAAEPNLGAAEPDLGAEHQEPGNHFEAEEQEAEPGFETEEQELAHGWASPAPRPDPPLDDPFIVISSSTYMVEFANPYTVCVDTTDEVIGDEPWEVDTSPLPQLYAMVAGQVRLTADNMVELGPDQMEIAEPEIYSWALPTQVEAPSSQPEQPDVHQPMRINGWTVVSASNDILPAGEELPKRRRRR